MTRLYRKVSAAMVAAMAVSEEGCGRGVAGFTNSGKGHVEHDGLGLSSVMTAP